MKKIVVLLVLLFTFAAQADFVFSLSDDFAKADLDVVKLGPIDFGVCGAVGYDGGINSTVDTYIDFRDNYLGGYAKIQFLEGKPVRPYIQFSALIKNSTVENEYYIYEAGIDVKLGVIPIGIAYMRCDDGIFQDEDKFMLRIPIAIN